MMKPEISVIGQLIGDPSRAHMLMALMSGKALTATELAVEADISAQTATSHLNQLVKANLLVVRKQGRHKYFQLAGYQVADMLESILSFSVQLSLPNIETGPKDPELKYARVCYDHLAGEIGVTLYNSLRSHQYIIDNGDETTLTESGRSYFTELGFDFNSPRPTKRPLCKSCLDWSERTNHLSGVLGKWIFDELVEQKIIEQEQSSRAVRFTQNGYKKFKNIFKLL